MSLYKDASLVMIPSAVKDGKLYSIRPTDGAGDFTFSRGSNLAATRVDVNGLIEKGRENLLLQSNQFDTTWITAASITRTSGQSGYDGTNDAWKLESDGVSAYDAVYQNISISGVNTYSVYAKAGTNNIFALRSAAAVDARASFNLSAVSVSVNSSVIDASIESVGNDWYRCSMTFNAINSLVYIYPNELGIASAGYIYIQDSQLEQGLVSTSVIETGASTAQAGILENTPRLDYSGGASCPALLLEPLRTNIVDDSEYVTGYFSQASAVVSYNEIISPEGVQNAFKLTSTTNGQARIEKSRPVGGTDTYTLSVFLKAGNSNFGSLANFNGGASVRFNLADGTIQGSGGLIDSDIIPIGNDGWYRCYMVFQEKVSQTANIYKILVSSDGETYFANNGDYIYGYGAQLELGSYPTSYIPTMGSAVTRSGDNTGAIDVSSLGVTTGYTLFYELGDFNVAFGGVWLAQAGGGDRPYQVYGATAVIKTNSGDAYPFNHGTLGKGTGIKVAVNYDGTNINVFTNGTKRGTWAANKTIWDALTDLDMNLSSVQMVNWKQLLVFPTALTDSECIALTTI